MKKVLLRWIHPANFIKASYQLFFLLTTLTINLYLLRRPIHEFHPKESFPQLLSVNEETIKQWGKKPAVVKTGITINDFTKFDINNKNFTVNATVWFIFNQQQIDLEQIEKFSFTHGTVVQKNLTNKPLAQINNKASHEVVAVYDVTIEFSSPLNFQRFPLDDHRLILTLTNVGFSPQDVVFKSDMDSFKTDENIHVFGWSLKEKGVVSGYSKKVINSRIEVANPEVAFCMGFSKYELRLFLFLLLPILFLFYLGIFAFSFQDSMALVLTSFPSLLGFAAFMHAVVPVAGYFLLSDYLFLYFGIGTFIIFCIRSLKENITRAFSEEKFKTIAGSAMMILNGGFVVLWYYLTNVKDLA